MERVTVSSSQIRSIGFAPESDLTGVLEVEFTNGSVYRYRDVPAALHEELMGSESVGKVFGAKVRNIYHSERVS
jgi:hypothetical protein